MKTTKLIVYTLFVILPLLACAGLAYMAFEWRELCVPCFRAADDWWQIHFFEKKVQ